MTVSFAAKSPAALPAATQGDAAALCPLSRRTQPAESLLERSGESSGLWAPSQPVGTFGTEGVQGDSDAQAQDLGGDHLEPDSIAPVRARKEGAASPQVDARLRPVVEPASVGAAPTVLGKPMGELARRTLELIAKTGTPVLKAAAAAELARRSDPASSRPEFGAVAATPSATECAIALEKQAVAEPPSAQPATLSAISSRSSRETQTDRAIAWLRSRLAGGPAKAAELQREAQGIGFSPKTLRRAREQLSVLPMKREFAGGWWWSFPAEDALDCRIPSDEGTLGNTEGHLRVAQEDTPHPEAHEGVR